MDKLQKLPKTTGVYLFYEKDKNPIYIGKAKNIKERVRNHHDFFMPKVKRIKYIETSSEIEALILEASLIKKHQPKYNVAWKDGKNYFYVALRSAQGKLKIPYIYVTHQFKNYKIKNSKIRYIGPFVEGTALKKTLRFLRRVFPYYTGATHPKTKCTWCHLDLCPGVEPNLLNYRKNIKKLILILQGKRSRVLSSMKNEMKQLSKERKFEEAGKLRDRIYNLQQVMAHINVISEEKHIIKNYAIASFMMTFNRIEAYDVSNIQGQFATGSMVVFSNGQPNKSEYKKFKIKIKNKPNDIAMLKEVLQRRFAHPEWTKPDAILIDGGKAQLNITIKNSPKNVKIFSIAKGRQELFSDNWAKPIPLKNLPQETHNLIKRLDDEAHRFAINYHKKLRKTSLLP